MYILADLNSCKKKLIIYIETETTFDKNIKKQILFFLYKRFYIL